MGEPLRQGAQRRSISELGPGASVPGAPTDRAAAADDALRVDELAQALAHLEERDALLGHSYNFV